MQQPTKSQEPPAGCPAHGRVPLYGPEFGADPDGHYEHLRGFGPTAPVLVAPGVEAELVTSYSAALRILQDPATFVRDSRRWRALNEGRIPADSPALAMMGYRPNALFSDGSEHARLRQAVTDSLATVDQHRLTIQVQQVAEYLISQFSSRRRGDVDLVADYAQQLPLLVYSDLFGCPADIGDNIIYGISGIFENAQGADEVLSEALGELIALKRRKPGNDVTSHLMAHPAGLNDGEMAHQVVTLLSGLAPLQSLISIATALMLGDEKYAAGLGSAGLLVEDAVNEVLWNYAPIANYAVHYPVRDVELNGRVLPANDPVVISFAAANTDPELTAGPVTHSGRAHLAFGAGPHVCPARDPAMVISVAAIEALLNRLPDIELDVSLDELSWVPAPWSRSLLMLPARFTPAPARMRRPPASTPAVGVSQAPAQPAPSQSAKATRWSRFLTWLNG